MKSYPLPDAWMVLVLRTMSAVEIREAIREETDTLKLRWLKDALRKKEAA